MITGASPEGDRAVAADAVEPLPVSPVPASIPGADIVMVAADLMAMAEEAYYAATWAAEVAGEDVPLIEHMDCDEDGVCRWQACQAVGCIIDKWHRAHDLYAQGIAARSDETANAGSAAGKSPVT